MKICGIKLTHDGALALIDNGRLVFSYEMEKIDNGIRHSIFKLSLEEINEVLLSHGYRFDEIDHWAIDGWGEDIDPRNVISNDFAMDFSFDGKKNISIKMAEYGNLVGRKEDVLCPSHFSIPELGLNYTSYMHVTGHIASAYCTSPFARRQEDSFILVWDGGMPPQLFYLNHSSRKIENLGPLFYLMGHIYISFPHQFPPFNDRPKEHAIAGKAMAYIALGSVREDILARYHEIYKEVITGFTEENIDVTSTTIFTYAFIKKAKEYQGQTNASGEDMMRTFHHFLQELILNGLEEKLEQLDGYTRNICSIGGCALNIKWNSAIRDQGLFNDIWVAPFANDSGSAIGVACCEMIRNSDHLALDWNVYAGPPLAANKGSDPAFGSMPCNLEDLAFILHESKEPLVFLNGAAELGPRALGNRSILAAADSMEMKAKLNDIKIREDYRPVAPICLEADAPTVFSPGTPDPYMLFEHVVRPEAKERVPAIVHLDGTARLQTVNATQNDQIFQLLSHYKALSGIPLLCNTSANLKGRGFFPDVRSAMEWGRANLIWSEGLIYYKKDAGLNKVLDQISQKYSLLKG